MKRDLRDSYDGNEFNYYIIRDMPKKVNISPEVYKNRVFPKSFGKLYWE